MSDATPFRRIVASRRILILEDVEGDQALVTMKNCLRMSDNGAIGIDVRVFQAKGAFIDPGVSIFQLYVLLVSRQLFSLILRATLFSRCALINLQHIILEMIAKGESLTHTTVRLCQEVERRFPEIICSVLTIDASGKLCTLAGPSLPEEYCSAIDELKIGPNVGSCGTAAFTGREVVCTDIATDPRWDSYRHLALPLGLKACWSSPIFGFSSKPIGTFAFYYRDCRSPSEIERTIVAECVHLTAIALDRHQRVLEHERRANTDVLTGLGNRSAFDTALNALDCAIPGNWALCLIDLDNLKVINDTFGHHAGDELLSLVAKRISKVADPDPVFRIGGDEFAVIITQHTVLGALDSSMESFLREIGKPVDKGAGMLAPRATIGFAVCSAGDLLPEAVRHNADFALYHAKETGRGGALRYSSGIGSRIERRLKAIRDVEAALKEDRIVAYYQPILKLDTGEVVGVEALARMHIADAILPANMFHEATTDANVASLLTARMIEQIAANVREWLDMGIPFQHVGINVSSADFHNNMIYGLIDASFGKHEVPLHHVILEVTESVYMDDDAGIVRSAIANLREQGLKIALDDFGTGYASLTHLLQFPVDIIKIDKSFVNDLTSSQPASVIVGGLLRIAKELGIRVVAEGVETLAQEKELKTLGCHLGQGFLYSPALEASAAGALMKKHAQGTEQFIQAGVAEEHG